MVTAKITCLPSNLSPSQSYYQDGHDDTSESRGVYDEERSSYFPMHRVHLGYLSTRKPRNLYVRCECKYNLFTLKLVSFS